MPRRAHHYYSPDRAGQGAARAHGGHPALRLRRPDLGHDPRLDRAVVHGLAGLRSAQLRRPGQLHVPVHELPVLLDRGLEQHPLAALFVGFATPMGILLAVCLDRPLRASGLYQTHLLHAGRAVARRRRLHLGAPVLAARGQRLHRQRAGGNGPGERRTAPPTGSATPRINIWAVIVAASWRHIGYIMVLYLAGLKSVDPSLREAAAIDGANERQTFFHVVFPVMAPINVGHRRRDGDRIAAGVRHRLHHQPRQERPRAAVHADHQQRPERGQPDRLRLRDRGRPAADLARADRAVPDPRHEIGGTGEHATRWPGSGRAPPSSAPAASRAGCTSS